VPVPEATAAAVPVPEATAAAVPVPEATAAVLVVVASWEVTQVHIQDHTIAEAIVKALE